MKKGASSQVGKSRFHPSRISGMQKQARVRDWEARKKDEKKRPKTPVFNTVKELFNS